MMKRKHFSRFLLTVAIVLMVLGIVTGQNTLVLTKAVQICLECIGIG